MPCYCCVSGCKSNNHKPTDKHFFRFPKNDDKRRRLWMKFARKKVTETSVICSDHFEPGLIIKRDRKQTLDPEAIPTIFFNEFGKISLDFDGEDYVGEFDISQETSAIETAFVEEQPTIEDIKSRCRFCAELNKEVIEMATFSDYNIDIDNFLQILNLCNIQSEYFPVSVCEECFNQVLLLETFIAKCKGADQWFCEAIEKLTSSHLGSNAVELEDVNLDLIEECETDVEGFDAIEDEATEPGKYQETEADDVMRAETEAGAKNIPIMDPQSNKFALKSYACEICLNIFAGRKTYRNHICNVPEIRCQTCGDTFENVFDLKSHEKRLHKNLSKKKYCSNCKTVITGNETAFKKHQGKCGRNGETEFKCDECGKQLPTLHLLSVHKMFHSSQNSSEQDVLSKELKKPKKQSFVMCETCGKSYSSVGDCRRHIRLKHTEIVEKFWCDLCHKQYPTKSVLNDHIRNTHVVNEVPCTFCGKIFRNKTHLKKHMIYHDESKKIYKCLICPQQPGFLNKAGLIRHQARHAHNAAKRGFGGEKL